MTVSTIVPISGDDASSLWLWGTAADAISGRAGLHVIPIIAWAIDGESVLPITPSGKADAGGTWLIATGSQRFITSGSEILENQFSAQDWLKEKSAQ